VLHDSLLVEVEGVVEVEVVDVVVSVCGVLVVFDVVVLEVVVPVVEDVEVVAVAVVLLAGFRTGSSPALS